MYTKNFLAAGALISAVAAVPMAKRDIVWVTETDEAVVTVPVTQTVWVNPGESVPATKAHWGHHSHYTPSAQPTVTESSAAPASTESSAEPTSAAAPSSSEEPTTSSSVYVAPTTSSTSVYVAPTTSSVYVAPTTSSVYVAPTTSSVYVAPTTSSTSVYVAPTTSSAPAPSTYSAASSTTTAAASGTSPSGATYTGDITYYDVGLGSCGWTSTDSDAIVAIPHGMMNNGINPNDNPLCGTYITISYEGATHQAKIVDTCEGCDGASIDLSPTLFSAVAPDGNGRVHGVEWWYNSS